MNWENTASVLVGVVAGGLLAILGSYLSGKFQYRYRIREANIALAEFLGEWVRPTYVRVRGKPTNEDLWRIQAAYWKSIPWLGDKLVREAIKTLAGVQGAVSANALIAEIRKVLVGNSKLKGTELNMWEPDLSARDQNSAST